MSYKKRTDRKVTYDKKKEAYWTRIQEVADKYQNVVFVDVDNVSSLQVAKLRMNLNKIGAYMIMRNNTLSKAALTASLDKADKADTQFKNRLEKIIGELKGNTNLIFTHGDIADVKEVLDNEVRPSPAKAGMIAPADVTIPAGKTGLDVKKTSFFGHYNIATKIVKSQVDIVSATKVVSKGDKVNTS